ncbi:hypothetical protein [Mucilaginibacter paludis]|uniref:Stationary phase survival protein SurE n=1 Tax=Mucilaginibacter paludis DSM 18603 TaxID=714943 RepID=H1YAW6_9SPHI|nr:hypothetical protein [Mucilaginibacter paludis]EHQ29575.1 hypothetical protein Mucpa_5503 [Mucilaginibacter paludis DSM 18603]
MNQKVQFVAGLLSGIVLPALAWLIFDVVFKNAVLLNKPAIPYLACIAINLLVLRYFIRHGKPSVGYGLMTTTFVIAIMIFKLKV